MREVGLLGRSRRQLESVEGVFLQGKSMVLLSAGSVHFIIWFLLWILKYMVATAFA